MSEKQSLRRGQDTSVVTTDEEYKTHGLVLIACLIGC